jgi:predicted nucleic acid-binding protein
MSGKLIDTNVLVYAYDTSEGEKHIASRDLVRQLWIDGGGVVCLQNLMEFFVVITRKVEHPVDVATATGLVQDFIGSDKWTVIDRDADTLLSAFELVAKHGIHLWDAAIAATMMENDVSEIVTENSKDFSKIPALRVVAPF